VIKVTIHRLLLIPLKLVGDLVQPFDGMDYIWVQHNASENGSGQLAGLTGAEVDLLNMILPNNSILRCKDTKKGGSRLGDIVVTTGSHLVLVIKGLHAQPLVLLDYAFNAPPGKKCKRRKNQFIMGADTPEMPCFL
jgi:hypothetical protein